MYRVTITSWGGTEKVLVDGLTRREAIEMCEEYGYEWTNPTNEGYVWDMSFEWYENDEEA